MCTLSDQPLRRSRAKKWHSDDSEESEGSDGQSSDAEAEEQEEPIESASSGNENDAIASPRDEALGRGARTRAKVGHFCTKMHLTF